MLKDAFARIYDKTGDEERIPKITPLVGNGVAYSQMENLHLTIHQQLSTLLRRENEPDLPEGFNYVGFDILNPVEEYAIRGEGRNKQAGRQAAFKEGFQYLPTDTYYVRFKFVNGDQELNRNMQIPFLRRGSIMRLKGIRYSISPVLKTRGVSITPKGFFVSFDSNQVNFEQESKHFLINGSAVHYFLPFSNDLHRFKKRGSKLFKPPIVGWLFAKWGVKEAFQRYLGIDIKTYAVDDPAILEYDTREYAICRAPIQAKRERYTSIAIVIPKDKMSKEVEIFVGTVFYITSFYGDRVTEDLMDSVPLWRILLGYSVHGEAEFSDPKHLLMIDKHLNETVEKYLDPIFEAQLLHEGLEFDDIYEFFFYVVTLYTSVKSNATVALANAWGRYLTCAEYVLVGIRHNIRKCMWELKDVAKNVATGETGLPISKSRLSTIINRKISSDILTNITSGHGEVALIQVTTDNMLIGITSRVIDETDAKKSSGSSKKVVDLKDPTKHIHASWIEVGSIANLPRSTPFGLGILNPYVKIDHWGKIVRQEKNKDTLNRAQLNLRQKGHQF